MAAGILNLRNGKEITDRKGKSVQTEKVFGEGGQHV
jgi:hypothetical protein